MRSEFGQRLFEARKRAGLTQADAAKGIMGQSTLAELEKVGQGSAHTTALAKRYGVDPDWLATGLGEPTIYRLDPSKVRKTWVVGKGSGGLMPERLWTDGDHPVGVTDEYAEVSSSDPHAFLFEVIGSSMYPKFENKNFALVEPGTHIDIEDCVLVRLKDGQTLLKRLLSRRNGIVLGSYNEIELLEYQEDDISWMYYVAHEVPRKKIKSRL